MIDIRGPGKHPILSNIPFLDTFEKLREWERKKFIILMPLHQWINKLSSHFQKILSLNWIIEALENKYARLLLHNLWKYSTRECVLHTLFHLFILTSLLGLPRSRDLTLHVIFHSNPTSFNSRKNIFSCTFFKIS